MEGLVAFESPLVATDDSVDFAADFVESATASAPKPETKSPIEQHAAEVAWLFQQASRSFDLGEVENHHFWLDVGERLSSLVNELSEQSNPDQRAEVLNEIADLRRACRRTVSWRSTDYDWPLLTD